MNEVFSANHLGSTNRNPFLTLVTWMLYTVRWENVNSNHIKNAVLSLKGFHNVTSVPWSHQNLIVRKKEIA